MRSIVGASVRDKADAGRGDMWTMGLSSPLPLPVAMPVAALAEDVGAYSDGEGMPEERPERLPLPLALASESPPMPIDADGEEIPRACETVIMPVPVGVTGPLFCVEVGEGTPPRCCCSAAATAAAEKPSVLAPPVATGVVADEEATECACWWCWIAAAAAATICCAVSSAAEAEGGRGWP